MLFNSYTFIFIFLPVTLLGFHLLRIRSTHNVAISWLVVASLFFYGWWNLAYLGLIVISMLFNYLVGIALLSKPKKILLIVGISANLITLGYFKYANFFIENISVFIENDLILKQVILPLAISFFTFQQITYLTDAFRGKIQEHCFLHYCLFVTFFPQLIAGPIVHHKEMFPQFSRNSLDILRAENLAIGFTLFIVGLFKKVCIADSVALYATPVFTAAEQGVKLTFFEAWGGALAYTFQLYFDFSGYSDMAIGLACMFGVILPVNFYSPYKAKNIIEFWQRWHITLSRFFRDYVYIPLGGSRVSLKRHFLNLLMTMLLCGLWHGAGWTFILWGGIHGCYLIINHSWHSIKSNFRGIAGKEENVFWCTLSQFTTFTAVVIAWVVFRAESMEGAIKVYEGMFALNGFSVPKSLANVTEVVQIIFPNSHIVAEGLGTFGGGRGVLMLIMLLFVVYFLPNTAEWLSRRKPVLLETNITIKLRKKTWLEWEPSFVYVTLVVLMAVFSIMSLSHVTEFLYFNF